MWIRLLDTKNNTKYVSTAVLVGLSMQQTQWILLLYISFQNSYITSMGSITFSLLQSSAEEAHLVIYWRSADCLDQRRKWITLQEWFVMFV